MAFSTIGVSKQKGGSVGASGRHNDRGRDTPNADPERAHLNRVLFGPDRNVKDIVREIIEEHGGKPRRDSVEAVELLLSASHEFFEGPDGNISMEKVDRFCEQAMKFLEDARNCGICAKVVLHMDERTPHIHAHMVPITEKGRLSATHFLDGRKKMKELHTRYAEYMKPLGLERGREGSRATHQRVKQFYASVTKEPELVIDPERIPDPSRFKLLTIEGVKQYKQEVLKAVLEQLKEPIRVLQDQAMLTRDEHAHRVEADKRAEAARREADARVEAVERAAQEKIAAFESKATDYVHNLERTARATLEENRELRGETLDLRSERDQLKESLRKVTSAELNALALARTYSDRLTDIPMPEVMGRLGYVGELAGQAHLYRDNENVVAIRIDQQKAFDSNDRLICRNSLDLVVHMRQHNEGVEDFTHNQALNWLRDEFGAGRAAGAAVAHREQTVLDIFSRQDRARAPRVREHDRDSHDRGGGGGRGFSR